jgi:hypothetical protein
MSMLRSSVVIAIVLVLGTVTFARADEPASPAAPAPAHPAAATPEASPLNYVGAGATTTLFHKPNSGPASGWQKDITPAVGYGRYVTDTIALELDFGPSFVRGSGYSGFFLVPGAVWSFSTHFYAAARFLVEVDPEIDFALYPGIGGIYAFPNQVSLVLELNLESFIGRGNPDLAVALTPGIVYSF